MIHETTESKMLPIVPEGGVAPPSRVYESLVLTLELHRQ